MGAEVRILRSAASPPCAALRRVSAGLDIEQAALRDEEGDHQRAYGSRAQQGAAPAGRAHHGDGVGRRRRIAEVAGDAVPAERVAKALPVHARIQDREIAGMEHAVADAADQRGHQQHRVAVREPCNQCASSAEHEPEEQHPARAVAVHREAGRRLADAADHVVERDHAAQRDVGDAQIVLDEREHHRGGDLEEMRQAVGKGHQADGAHVCSKGLFQ